MRKKGDSESFREGLPVHLELLTKMATELSPSIVTNTFSLDLQHPAIPYPLTLIVNQLSSVSVMLFISTPPASQSSMMKDTSVAMPVSIYPLPLSRDKEAHAFRMSNRIEFKIPLVPQLPYQSLQLRL